LKKCEKIIFENLENKVALENKKGPFHLESSDFQRIFDEISPKIRKTGGTAVNILKVAAKFGADCFFSGSVGANNEVFDDDATFFQTEMKKKNVECQLFSRNFPTGRFLTVYDENKEKTVFVSVEAAKKIEVSQVNEIRFAHSSCFVMEGMQFLNQEILEKVIDLAFAYNVPIAIDCGTIFGAEAVGKRLHDISHSLDVILFANEAEATVLKKYEERPEENCLLYVEKLGKNGAKAYFDKTEYFSEAKKIDDSAFVDDTGAGDTFAGAFLYKIFEKTENKIYDATKEGIEEALSFAIEESGKALETFGV
jgi:sugar/nucleoside kinase (ribokinase family)